MGATEDAALIDMLRGLEGEALTAKLLELAQERASAKSSGGPYATLATLGELQGSANWFEDAPPDVNFLFSRPDEETRDENGKVHSWTGAVPRAQIMFLAGDGEVGKTWVGIAAAVSVATGHDWLGKFKVNSPGTSVGLFGELSETVFRNRLKAVIEPMHLTAEEKKRAVARFRPLMLANKDADRLIDLDRGQPYETPAFHTLLRRLQSIDDLRLIVVDTLALLGSPDAETNQAGATATIKALGKIAALPSEPVVMVLHHTSQAARDAGTKGEKPSVSWVRGVTSLTNNARVVWIMTPHRSNQDLVFITGVKANDVPHPSHFTAAVMRQPGGALYRMTREQRVAHFGDRAVEDVRDEMPDQATAADKPARGSRRSKPTNTGVHETVAPLPDSKRPGVSVWK
jgi:hypothetical protein